MRLLEFQAKQVLAENGVAVPAGQLARSPAEAATACAELGPVAVKAQVPVGGRGKAGGIKLASDPQQARAHAQQILGMSIAGYSVRSVYCEQALDIAQEIYLGFTVDRAARSYILMLSASGGMDIEAVAANTPEAIARLYPEPWRGPLDFEVRAMAFQCGLGHLAAPLGGVVASLYRALCQSDAVTAEINPLVVTGQGALIAGDAKWEIDDNALSRHPELSSYAEEMEVDRFEAEAKRRNLTYVSLDGEIGVIGNGAGLCMNTLDLVKRSGGSAANFCDIGGGARASVVKDALEVILMNPKVRGVLINVFGGITRCDEVAEGLIQARSDLNMTLPLVVRLTGTREQEGRAILVEHGIEPGNDAVEAAAKIVSLTR